MSQKRPEDSFSSASSSAPSSTSISTNANTDSNTNKLSSTSASNASDLRRLLPQPAQPPRPSADQAPGGSSGSSSTTSSDRLQTVSKLRARAKQVDIACEACRKHKVKCTAERPRCRRCARRDEDCHYDTPEFGKVRYDALKKSYDDLVSDRESCQQLFGLLETAGEGESQHILGQIRQGQDATSVLRHVREANLLVDFSGGMEEQETGSGVRGGGVDGDDTSMKQA